MKHALTAILRASLCSIVSSRSPLWVTSETKVRFRSVALYSSTIMRLTTLMTVRAQVSGSIPVWSVWEWWREWGEDVESGVEPGSECE